MPYQVILHHLYGKRCKISNNQFECKTDYLEQDRSNDHSDKILKHFCLDKKCLLCLRLIACLGLPAQSNFQDAYSISKTINREFFDKSAVQEDFPVDL
jgi:hypothetical protein